jgi:hypothetical protein
MPSTPNHGWPTPSDADYVINGAAAIRDLADAIDANAVTTDGGDVTINGTVTVDSGGTTAKTVDVVRQVSSANTTARVVVATHGNGSAMLQRLRGTEDEVGLRVEGNGQAGVVKGSTHRPLPFAVATGTDTSAAGSTTTVTFPSGRFTASPVVTLTAVGAVGNNRLAMLTAVTSSSFTFEVRTASTESRIAATTHWQAIQLAA